MVESFDPLKLVTSPFTGMFWVKTIMFGLGLACLGFIGYGVYLAYFATPDPTTTQNNRAAAITYHYHQPKATFGCASYQVNEYYRDRLTNRTK